MLPNVYLRYFLIFELGMYNIETFKNIPFDEVFVILADRCSLPWILLLILGNIFLVNAILGWVVCMVPVIVDELLQEAYSP